jgi:hypothetical protein
MFPLLFHDVTNAPDDFVIRVQPNPALRCTYRVVRIYAREERVVDWSSVDSDEAGLQLRYGPRRDWLSKNGAEWAREGRPQAPPGNIVYRVGPPLPPYYPRKKKTTSPVEKGRRKGLLSKTSIRLIRKRVEKMNSAKK